MTTKWLQSGRCSASLCHAICIYIHRVAQYARAAGSISKVMPAQAPHPSLGRTASAFAAHLATGQGTIAAALSADIRLLKDRCERVTGEPTSHGREHDVWLTAADDLRVLKLTRLPSRPYGISTSAADYLRRWARANTVFADDIRVEGILPDERFIISQPFVAGEHPDRHQLHQWLRAVGWLMYRNTDNIWQSPDGRLLMSEAHAGNFIQQANGTIRPIDVALHSREEWLQQIAEDEFAEAYGPTHVPVSIESLLQETDGDLSCFGFAPAEN